MLHSLYLFILKEKLVYENNIGLFEKFLYIKKILGNK